MEIDGGGGGGGGSGGGGGGGGTDNNLDADILAKFGSLQTLDKPDLISQMKRLIGDPTLGDAQATFYLDMNHWNVAAAVGAYFDLEAGAEARSAPPQMTFVKDVTIGEGESVPPETTFIKTWTVQNTGPESWPPGCALR